MPAPKRPGACRWPRILYPWACGLRATFSRLLPGQDFIIEPHRQSNTFALQINLYYLYLHERTNGDYLMRIFHKLIRQGRDMHQTVLMHADIDKGSKVSDVGHNAFQDQARFEIFERFYAFFEGRGFK